MLYCNELRISYGKQFAFFVTAQFATIDKQMLQQNCNTFHLNLIIKYTVIHKPES